jgi:hypothetical protein
MAVRIPKIRGYRGSQVKSAPRGARTKSSVVHGQIHPEAILVIFKEHGGQDEEHAYLYTYASAGEAVVEEMKSLLRSGHGLNRYINATHPGYDQDAALYGYSPSTPSQRLGSRNKVGGTFNETEIPMGFPSESNVLEGGFSFVLPDEGSFDYGGD